MISSTPTTLSFSVAGTPAPQGSKRHVGGGRLIESSKKVGPWRAAVALATRRALTATGHPPFTGPCIVSASFIFERPQSHYGTGRNAHTIRPSAPEEPTSRNVYGDLDKLARALLDALTEGGAIEDDSLVVGLSASKAFVRGDLRPGAYVRIAHATSSERKAAA